MRKSLLFGVLGLMAMLSSGCGYGDLKTVIEHHFKALNRHDVTELLKDYDANVQCTAPNWEGIRIGTQPIKSSYTHSFRSTPNLRYDVGNVYFTGDSVITVQYTTSGTLSAPEAGTPDYMRGQKYILDNSVIIVIRKGKIVREDTYFDQVAFLRQVGFFDH